MKVSYVICAISACLFISCGEPGIKDEGESNAMYEKKAYTEYTEAEEAPAANEEADSTINGYISSSAAKVNSDTSRKFVRTANMKFKVKDVRKSTFGIEDIVGKREGFVTYTTLNSSVSSVNEIPVSADSILVTTRYTVSNTMTIRIPNEMLDSALREIAAHIEFLDFRTITADDVTLQMLSNRVMRMRLNQHGKRLTNAIDNRGKKLNETNNAEGNLLNRQMQADQMMMENLRLQANVDYSTIQLEFYQNETVTRELKYNDEDIEEYKPGFWSNVGDAFAQGWEFVKQFFIGLISIWPLILVGLGIVWLVKRITRKPTSR